MVWVQVGISILVFYKFVYIGRCAKTSSMGLPKTRKNFAVKPGSGWCVDKDGEELTSRNFASVGCWSAQNMCETDNYCVGFSCGASSGVSALYTATDCQSACENVDWVMNPALIIKASNEGARDAKQKSVWSQAKCYVATSVAELTAAAPADSTRLSVNKPEMFSVGDAFRIYTEIKHIMNIQDGQLVVAPRMSGSYRAGTKLIPVASFSASESKTDSSRITTTSTTIIITTTTTTTVPKPTVPSCAVRHVRFTVTSRSELAIHSFNLADGQGKLIDNGCHPENPDCLEKDGNAVLGCKYNSSSCPISWNYTLKPSGCAVGTDQRVDSKVISEWRIANGQCSRYMHGGSGKQTCGEADISKPWWYFMAARLFPSKRVPYHGGGFRCTYRRPGWFQIDFPSSFAISAFRFQTQSDRTYRSPKTWKFEGSSDGTTWFVLHEQATSFKNGISCEPRHPHDCGDSGWVNITSTGKKCSA